MKECKRTGSCFSSLPGYLLLFTLAIPAFYYRLPLPSAFLFFFLLLFLISGLWSRSLLKHLRLGVTPVHTRCHAGGTLSLKLSVRNTGLFPLLWADLFFPLGKRPPVKEADAENVLFTPAGGREALPALRQRIGGLFWQQELTWTLTLNAVKRGEALFSSVWLLAGDGLGLGVKEALIPLMPSIRLLIYPRLVPVTTRPFLKRFQDTLACGRGNAEDVTLLKSTRAYLPQDTARRINWRLLASTGQIYSNVYETLRPGCLTFLLDFASFRKIEISETETGTAKKKITLLEDNLEEMISLIASCLNALHNLSIPTALSLPGYGRHDTETITPAADTGTEDTLSLCMEALARVCYQAEDTDLSPEAFINDSAWLGDIYICALSFDACTLHSFAQQSGQNRPHYLFLERKTSLPDYEAIYLDELTLPE